jgi:hypothetical protein
MAAFRAACLHHRTPAEIRACKYNMRKQFAAGKLQLSGPAHSDQAGNGTDGTDGTNGTDGKSVSESACASTEPTLEQVCFDTIVQNHIKRCNRSTTAIARARRDIANNRKKKKKKKEDTGTDVSPAAASGRT